MMRTRAGLTLIVAAIAAACGGRSSPVAPTAAGVPAGFGSFAAPIVSVSASDFGACLARSTDARCFSALRIETDHLTATAAITVPDAPTRLGSNVSGGNVTLSWSAAPSGDPATSYIIEAGSAPGLADLANFSTGSSATSFSASGVGAGTYFVRVRAQNAAGISTVSNEITLVVGAANAPCVIPGAPGALTLVSNQDGTVVFTWGAVAGATSYVVEAGSAPGGANLANSDLGNTTTLTANGVGAGVYYVRVKAKNACGTGAASNEFALTVSGGSTAITFAPPTQLTATVGVPFIYSFCQPGLTNVNALCGPGATNPSGGQPPYHFQLGSGSGFPPTNVFLGLNGILSGTPTVAGVSSFRVCAVDLGGHSSCPLVTMTVSNPAPPPPSGNVSVTIRLTGCGPSPGGNPGLFNCTATAQVVLNRTIRSGYVSVFMGYGGSFYHGDVQVPAGSVAGTVTVAMKNEYISNCIRVQSTVVDVRDGPQGAPTSPLIASIPITLTSTCG